MTCSEYFTRAFPGLQRLGLLDPDIETYALKKIYAIVVIVIFTLIHMRGLVFGARIQNLLTVLKVVLIAGLIVFAWPLAGAIRQTLPPGLSVWDFPAGK